jgi:predicted nucleic acid-binding protein
MGFVVIYDACVLYPAALRDFLLRVARTGIVRARWSEKILDECFEAILRERPDLKPEALERTRVLMREAIPDCIVSGHENLIEGLTLPDPDDRHVLAAAIRSGAQTIVTFNLKDFPAATMDAFGVEARHPDDFLVDQIGLAPGLVVGALLEQAAALRNPSMTREQVLDHLRDQGLVQTAAKLRELLGGR